MSIERYVKFISEQALNNGMSTPQLNEKSDIEKHINFAIGSGALLTDTSKTHIKNAFTKPGAEITNGVVALAHQHAKEYAHETVNYTHKNPEPPTGESEPWTVRKTTPEREEWGQGYRNFHKNLLARHKKELDEHISNVLRTNTNHPHVEELHGAMREIYKRTSAMIPVSDMEREHKLTLQKGSS